MLAHGVPRLLDAQIAPTPPDAPQRASTFTLIQPDPACAACRIRVTPVLTLRGSEVDSHEPTAARDRAGRFLVGGGSGRLRVFGSDGAFVRAIDGFKSVKYVRFGRGDSVFVFDNSAALTTVLDADLSVSARTFKSPLYGDLLALVDGQLVTSGYVQTRAAAGVPLHMRDSYGKLLRSFGTDPAEVGDQPDRMLLRRLAVSSPGEFYAAPSSEYRIERWSSDLRLLGTMRREVPWFPKVPDTQRIRFPNFRPLPTQLLNLVQSPRSGLLTVMLITAHQPYSSDPALRGYDDVNSERHIEVRADQLAMGALLNDYVDTIIEMLDPRTGRLAASQRFSGFYNLVAQPMASAQEPLFWTIRRSADGRERIDIVRFELHHP